MRDLTGGNIRRTKTNETLDSGNVLVYAGLLEKKQDFGTYLKTKKSFESLILFDCIVQN